MINKILCSKCNDLPAERGYELPLCGRCRESASRYPIPLWAIAMLLPLALPVLYGLRFAPTVIQVGQAYHKGQLAEAAGQFDVAEARYAIVSSAYPGSSAATARLGISQYKAGHYKSAADTLNQLNGRKLMPWLAKEVMDTAADLQQKLNAEGGRQ